MALLATALILASLYRNHIEEHYDAHVFTHLEELVAAAEIDPLGNLQMHERPTDPRFYRLHSGWYWEIKNSRQSLAKSSSLGEEILDVSNLNFEANHDVQNYIWSRPAKTARPYHARILFAFANLTNVHCNSTGNANYR